MSKLSKMPRAEQWADRICKVMQQSVESILETGRLLLKAKADLPHGEWGRLFDDHLLPFGQSTADKLMSIARHPAIGNSEHVPNLPTAWGTLYELTKVPEPVLKNALKDGLITPDMPRKAVVALMPAKSKPEPEEPEPFHWMNAVGDLRVAIERVIEKVTADWPDDARGMVPNALRDLADVLESDSAHIEGNAAAIKANGSRIDRKAG